MIGDALFDDSGGEIGEALGNKIGYLAGNIAFEHVAKNPIKNNDEPRSEDVSQTKTELFKTKIAAQMTAIFVSILQTQITEDLKSETRRLLILIRNGSPRQY